MSFFLSFSVIWLTVRKFKIEIINLRLLLGKVWAFRNVVYAEQMLLLS